MKNWKVLSIAVLTIGIIAVHNISTKDQSEKVDIKFYNAVPIEMYSDEYLVNELPLFTDDDIEYYDWDQQIVKFKNKSEVKVLAMKDFEHNNQTLSSFATTLRDKFYVYVDDELIYEGFYAQSIISSFYAEGITLKDLDAGIKIEHVELVDGGNDERLDERLYKALKANRILKD